MKYQVLVQAAAACIFTQNISFSIYHEEAGISPVALSILISSPHCEATEVRVISGELLTSLEVSTLPSLFVSYNDFSISHPPAGVQFSHFPVAEL